MEFNKLSYQIRMRILTLLEQHQFSNAKRIYDDYLLAEKFKQHQVTSIQNNYKKDSHVDLIRK